MQPVRVSGADAVPSMLAKEVASTIYHVTRLPVRWWHVMMASQPRRALKGVLRVQ